MTLESKVKVKLHISRVKMCMWFGYNHQIIFFVTFFSFVNLTVLYRCLLNFVYAFVITIIRLVFVSLFCFMKVVILTYSF